MLCDKNHNTLLSVGITLHFCHFNGDQPLSRAAHSGWLSFDMESSIKVCWSRHNPISEQWVRKEGWPFHLCCQNDYPQVGKLHWGPTQAAVNRVQKEYNVDQELTAGFCLIRVSTEDALLISESLNHQCGDWANANGAEYDKWNVKLIRQNIASVNLKQTFV